MFKVGICGTIGSGKSTVCHIFEDMGIPVYFADDRADADVLFDGADAADMRGFWS